jgi:hypothetical protein
MPQTGACCELGRCEPVEARVRSYYVVVDPPFFDDSSRLVEIGEQVLVEALVAQTAIEALDEAILHRFARSDVVPLDAAILRPGDRAGERSAALLCRADRASCGSI